ncbi:hypothetical protein DFA_11936 [Cavenderia fasciculata]|uniref:Uncharacterized protein n=1 Tax=Cavenderia fasciculata TaxID=261658 RepID=F4QEW0_CACFS|nr:uncharacterized protein DFA_11936 [Cavenderia fasciculata]EGG14167.1 hypothetical protein DFA_11936 [Cavenderia fasciculata]|eukprot:XP_004350875.1 hypothetical protein DFA_11936 [Cavenderia fasciculata]
MTTPNQKISVTWSLKEKLSFFVVVDEYAIESVVNDTITSMSIPALFLY